MRFARAYLAALDAAGLNKSQAAAVADLTQSSISRLLSGERPIYADHMRALLRALDNPSDREHCLLQWLRDQCPDDLGERLVAHFGTLMEPRTVAAHADDLDRAVAAIRRAAEEGNVSAKKVVINLAKAVDPGGEASARRHAGDGPRNSVSASA